jgi:hypothetical protein
LFLSLYKGIPERVLHEILIFLEVATADYPARLRRNRGFNHGLGGWQGWFDREKELS